MNKIVISFLLSLIIVPVSAQFSANMTFRSMGQQRTFRVFSAEAGYRYEFNEDGQDGVIIVKKGSSEIIIMMPGQKLAMKGSASDPMSMGNDPLAAWRYYRDEGILKVEGKEPVNGISCTRSGLWNSDNPEQKMYTIWISEKYDFPLRMINHMDVSGEAVMELKNISPWTPDASSFSIPPDYQVMDMPKMNP